MSKIYWVVFSLVNEMVGFWFGKWCDNEPLRYSFPSLDIAIPRDAWVVMCGVLLMEVVGFCSSIEGSFIFNFFDG